MRMRKKVDCSVAAYTTFFRTWKNRGDGRWLYINSLSFNKPFTLIESQDVNLNAVRMSESFLTTT